MGQHRTTRYLPRWTRISMIIILTFSLTSFLSSGIPTSLAGPSSDEIIVTLTNDGDIITVNEGQLLVVKLEAQPGTGYAWEVDNLPSLLQQAGPPTIEADESKQLTTPQTADIVGNPVLQVFQFQPIQVGQDTLRLVYHRSWETDIAPTETFTLQIETQGDFTDPPPPVDTTPTPDQSQPTPDMGPDLALPSSHNWCDYGGCTPVKNQGQCGSCWAFATVGVVESVIKIVDGIERDLSEQYLVSAGTHGSCSGGYAAFSLFIDEIPTGEFEAGAVYEADFPYQAADVALNPPHPHHENLLSYHYVNGTVSEIKQAIHDYGPVYTSVCVGNAFNYYSGGVFQTNESSTCNGGTNHAVVLVGWNDNLGNNGAWIMRNSWGSYWGESGYMQIGYGVSGIGGYARYAVYETALPDAPGNLNATAISQSRIDLSWSDNSDNEDGFIVERAPAGSGNWSQLASLNANTVSYSDSNLSCETAYDYRVAASHSNGNSAYSTTASATTDPCTPVSTTLYVNHAANGANNGSSWNNAYTHLQDALAVAGSGAEIWVAAGTYYPDEGGGKANNDRTAAVELKDGVAVYGGFAGNETERSQRNWETNVTILSGDIDQNDTASPVTDPENQIIGSNSYNVVRSHSNVTSSATLDGFTITAGQALGSEIVETRGGGIHNRSGNPTYRNVIVTGNVAGHSGSGIYNAYSDPTFTNAVISNNSISSGFGGGVYNKASNVIYTDVTIIGNHAFNGGGVYSFSHGTPTFVNVTISGNTVRGHGAGVFTSSSAPVFTNVSISGNRADMNGGGIYNRGYDQSDRSTFHNSIIWNNQDSSGTGTADASAFLDGGAISFSSSLVQGHNPSGSGNLDGTLATNDPLFAAPASPVDAPTTGGDYRLSSGSPAIDAGDNALLPADTTTDRAGNPRVHGAAVDLGAYEYGAAPAAIPGDCNNDGVRNAADISALVLRLFNPAQFNNAGCDANNDGAVNAADVSATVILINGGELAPASAARQAAPNPAGPAISLAAAQPADPGTLSLPIRFSSGDASVSSLFFTLAYDAQAYHVDPADHNGDGIPDALALSLPAEFSATVQADPSAGELHILIADTSFPLAALTDGDIATLSIEPLAPDIGPLAAWISTDPAPSFGSTGGFSIPGGTTSTPADEYRVYLPFIRR